MNTSEKLASLRTRLSERGLSAWIVPSSDPHQSEYLAERFQTRAWLSGFNGSAGTLVVTKDRAALWTDSRYWLAAAVALEGSDIALQKAGHPDTPDIASWLIEALPQAARVGYDQWVVTEAQANDWQEGLSTKNISLEPSADVLDDVWTDRPRLPSTRIERWKAPEGCKSPREKLDQLQEFLDEHEIEWGIVSALDEIAWLLDLRGNDVAYNPVFYAWLLVNRNGGTLFVQEEKLDDELRAWLAKLAISLSPYESFGAWLQTLPSDDRAVVSGGSPTMAVRAFTAHMDVLSQPLPLGLWKAKKQNAEIEALAATLERDGAAVAKALVPLLRGLEKGEKYRETLVAAELAKARAAFPDYRGESFPAIVGFGANAAVVHYSPEKGKDALIEGNGVLLIDNGGQFLHGTTDMTRCFAIGEVSQEVRIVATLVLKGHIALARAVFPVGTTGQQLDILARRFLWNNGLNYGHGTGHGIGFYLCVHEGPQRIAANGHPIALEPGMVVSDEPGCYIENEFGIRLENMLAVETKPDLPGFLRFRTLTVFPFDANLFDGSLLDAEEVSWFRDHQEAAVRRLRPHIGKEEGAWLARRSKLPV